VFKIQVTECKSAADPGQAATTTAPSQHVWAKEPQKKENATLEQ